MARSSPTGLRCESRIDPLGIDEAHPRLSWVLESARRGQGQTAYQVLVATSPAALAAHRGDLWDSGRVVSSQSVQVAYGGALLESRAVCYWKVRVWDASGRVSPWSAPARWEMALLSPRDWTAVWVNDGKPNPASDEGFYTEDPAPLFRREFTLRAAVVRARLYITGLGYYEASLNGARVGDRVLDPGWTAYASRVYYSTYDVTRELRQGGNCLGVTVGNGWYNPLPLRMWGRLNLREHLLVGRPRFIAQLEVELADGSRQCDRERPRLAGRRRPAAFQQRVPGRSVRCPPRAGRLEPARIRRHRLAPRRGGARAGRQASGAAATADPGHGDASADGPFSSRGPAYSSSTSGRTSLAGPASPSRRRAARASRCGTANC